MFKTEQEYLYEPRRLVKPDGEVVRLIEPKVQDGCDVCKRDGKKSIVMGGQGPYSRSSCFECSSHMAEGAWAKNRLISDLTRSLATSDEDLLKMFRGWKNMTEKDALARLKDIKYWRENVSVFEDGKYIKVKDLLEEGASDG